jgi:hypothetical protein
LTPSQPATGEGARGSATGRSAGSWSAFGFRAPLYPSTKCWASASCLGRNLPDSRDLFVCRIVDDPLLQHYLVSQIKLPTSGPLQSLPTPTPQYLCSRVLSLNTYLAEPRLSSLESDQCCVTPRQVSGPIEPRRSGHIPGTARRPPRASATVILTTVVLRQVAPRGLAETDGHRTTHVDYGTRRRQSLARAPVTLAPAIPVIKVGMRAGSAHTEARHTALPAASAGDVRTTILVRRGRPSEKLARRSLAATTAHGAP